MATRTIKTKGKAVLPTDTEALDKHLSAYVEARRQRDAAVKTISANKTLIMEELERLGKDEYENTEGNRVVVTSSTSSVIDVERLRKRLGAAMWNKITTRVLDGKKLDAYVSSGEIRPIIVAACTVDKTGDSYIKVTVK